MRKKWKVQYSPAWRMRSMIEAIIHYQDSTLIMDLPRNIYDMAEPPMEESEDFGMTM